ncbi:hypothetical protein AVEN_171173-1 [Araneus ventricosus]|uniref:Uncharacterized protein n=1 Tax=Araneus ventricosus TaxID=182803 RepID=A0A4Y2F9S8_ARAVE|nr:hypothetical protein AVEN_171173-1 [Araneus ventricosus]
MKEKSKKSKSRAPTMGETEGGKKKKKRSRALELTYHQTEAFENPVLVKIKDRKDNYLPSSFSSFAPILFVVCLNGPNGVE